jgi:hypothetical protein
MSQSSAGQICVGRSWRPASGRDAPRSNLSLPDSRHKPRNAGSIIATNRETKTFAGEIRLKQGCSRQPLGRRFLNLPPNCAGACRYKGNGHDRSPSYRACHRCDGNTSNDHGDGARLKVGILLVARNCPCRNGLGGTRHPTPVHTPPRTHTSGPAAPFFRPR